MYSNQLSADDISKLVATLISLNGSVIQLAKTLRSRSKWTRRAEAEVGTIGQPYGLVIKFPIVIHYIFLFIILFLSFVGLIGGAMWLKNMTSPRIIKTVFENSIFICILYGAFALLFIHFNCLSHLLLFVSRMFDNNRFKPGWTNSDWQLNHYKDFIAMNTDHDSCLRLATSILNLIKTEKKKPLPEQAPHPPGLSTEALANYLLVGCTIESRIHQLYRNDKSMLSQSWKYLAWVTQYQHNMFKPKNIKRFAGSDRSFYQELRKMEHKVHQNGGKSEGSLPDNITIDKTVQKVVDRLARKFQGKGSRLANRLRWFFPSPMTLDRKLGKFERFKGPKNKTMRRLFLKLAIRMNIWPTMAVGPFLYPYNNRIALLLLNSNCLLIPSDLKQIYVEENFSALVTWTEDKIVKLCHDLLLKSAKDTGMIEFTQKVFGYIPDNVDLWLFSDYIDLWLFGYTRQYCKAKKSYNTAVDIGCKFIAEPAAPCNCDEIKSPWYLGGISLTRDKG